MASIFDTIKKVVVNAIPGVGFVNSVRDATSRLQNTFNAPQPVSTPQMSVAPQMSMAPVQSRTPVSDNLISSINQSVAPKPPEQPTIRSGVRDLLSKTLNTQLPKPLADASVALQAADKRAIDTGLVLPINMAKGFIASANSSAEAGKKINDKNRLAQETGTFYPMGERVLDNLSSVLNTAGAVYQMTPAGASQKLLESAVIAPLQAARTGTSATRNFGDALADPLAGVGSTGLGLTGLPAIATDIAGSLFLDPNLEKIANRLAPDAAKVAPDAAKVAPEAQDLTKTLTGPEFAQQKLDELLAGNTTNKNSKLSQEEQILKDLQGRSSIQDIEQSLGLTPTPDSGTVFQKGTKEGRGFLSNALKGVEEKISMYVGGLKNSANPIARTIGETAGGLYSNLGISNETGKVLSRSQSNYANILADATSGKIYDILGNSKKSLQRVHAVLDPSLNKGAAVLEATLSPAEKDALSIYRLTADFINDTNYKNGLIDRQLWKEGKGGTYIKRLYETDIPNAWSKVSVGTPPLNLKSFIQRKDLTDKMVKTAIKDPAYLLAKKLHETIRNDEMLKVTEQLAQDGKIVSDHEVKGFLKVKNDPVFGAFAGKYVDKKVLDQIQGYSFNNEVISSLYDFLNLYDKLLLRQFQKKMLTVFNLATVLGNTTSNYVFAGMSGIDPISFQKSKNIAEKMIASNDPIYRQAAKEGLFGNNSIIADLKEISNGVINELPPGSNPLKLISDYAIKNYAKTDDVAKLASINHWLSKGYSWEESVQRTSRAFQNYHTVGFLFDIGSKVPVFGDPFVKFQGDIVRMIKNSAIDNPFGLAAMIATWKLATDASSKFSGETSQDKATRESRLGAPRIPFTNISLLTQTPIGELNVARLLGANVNERKTSQEPFGSKLLGDALQFAPFDSPLNFNDPTLGPLASLLADRDFRGKQITDPSLYADNKSNVSSLTDQEMLANKSKYLARSYSYPLLNSASDFVQSLQGKPDLYGNEKTPVQAGLRIFPGVKLEQFGPDKAQENRDRASKQSALDIQTFDKSLAKNADELASGKIDQATFDKRATSLEQKAMEPFLKQQVAPATTSTPASKTSNAQTALADTQVVDDASFDLVVKAKIKHGIVPTANDLNRYYFKEEDFQSTDANTINKAYSALLSKMNSKDVPEEVKSKLVASTGVNPADFQYYTDASATKTEKIKSISDKLSTLPRDEALNFLMSGKKTINGKAITSSYLVDYLYDHDVITKEEKALVAAIKYDENNGQYYMDKDYKASSGGSASKRQSLLNKINSGVYQIWKTQQPDPIKLSQSGVSKALKQNQAKTTLNRKPIALDTGSRSFQVKRKQTL